jgi:hypothetical protein
MCKIHRREKTDGGDGDIGTDMNDALAPDRFDIHQLMKKCRLLNHRNTIAFTGDYSL